MNLTEVTGLVTALTALAIAVGGVLAHIRTLREVKAGNVITGEVHQQLNSAKHAADKYQQDLRQALQNAGVAIPDDNSLEAHGHAIREEKGWRELGSNQYGNGGSEGDSRTAGS